MQYRNVRVENLAPGVPKAADGTGPFTITGTGPHTIEVRTNDAAGNAGSRSFDIEVGRVTPVGSTDTPVTVPLTPVSTIMPSMIDFPATFRLGSVTLEAVAGDVRPSRPDRPRGLHRRDGRLVEADGLQCDQAPVEAVERDARQQ